MLVLMTLSDLERRYARVKFLQRIFVVTLVPFVLEGTHSAGEHILRESVTSSSQGDVAQVSSILRTLIRTTHNNYILCDDRTR